MVHRNGVPMIRLDRPGEEIIRRFDPAKWNIETDVRPFTRVQVAQICKEMDRKLCYFLGKTRLANQEWLDMSEEVRVRWIKGDGPKKPEIRQTCFNLIYEALKGHVKDG
jgi:hypothetical protein